MYWNMRTIRILSSSVLFFSSFNLISISILQRETSSEFPRVHSTLHSFHLAAFKRFYKSFNKSLVQTNIFWMLFSWKDWSTPGIGDNMKLSFLRLLIASMNSLLFFPFLPFFFLIPSKEREREIFDHQSWVTVTARGTIIPPLSI